MTIVTISSRYQIVIPKDVRECLKPEGGAEDAGPAVQGARGG